MKKFFIIFIVVLIGLTFAHAPLLFCDEQAQEFKKNNPDGKKFEFARSYISSLSYLDSISHRWNDNNPKTRFADKPDEMFQAYVEYLALDNTELRIAKNFLVKYLNSSNVLMRKVSDSFIALCDQLIEINREERILWQEFVKVQKKKPENFFDIEKGFVFKQKELDAKRKELSKSFIEITVLMTRVLQSENSYIDAPYQLALSEEERKKLVKKLDEFAKDNLDWGIKSGQTPFQASVATIREMVEDPVWKSALK